MAPHRPLAFDPIAQAEHNWSVRGWSQAADGMALVTSIMRVQQLFLARIHDVLREWELTFSRFEVLMLLEFTREGQLPLNKIGERLQVHAASVTNAIDRLEAAGLVQRLPHPTDKRTTLASIRPAGRRVVALAADALNEQIFAAVELPRPAVRSVTEALAVLRRRAGDFD